MNSVWGLTCARRMRPVTALASALVAGVALAASEDGHREHAPHEHGHGALDIVLEGEDLVAELRIPAVNVVGFEHAPRDDAEREAVHAAVERFSDAAAVLVPSADAECEIEDAEAGIAGEDHDGHWSVGAHAEHEPDEEHEEEGHAKHEHDEEHEGEGHAKHEHDEEHEGEGHAKHEHDEEHEGEEHAKHEHEHEEHDEGAGAEAHSELHATYRFHCHAPQRLTRIDVRVFELLRDAEEISVRVVTATTQTAMDLHPGETVIELSP